MSLTRFVRTQLTIFSVLTVIGLVIMAVYFVRVPAMFGVGTIDVTADMPATGGLYVNANVTYNGDTIGKVKSVDLAPGSVHAVLRIDSGSDVPADSIVFVKSMSAVGEQFVDFVPKSAGGPFLEDGDTVTVTADTQPVPIGPLLDQANELLATVPEGKLKTVVDEAFTAFNGSSDDLRTLIDSTKEFVDAANANVEPTERLLQQAGPLLDTQVITSDQIRSWTQDLVTVTDQLRTSDPDIRKVLDVGPGAAASTTALFQGLQPTLPLLLANLASTSQVLLTYNPGLEQLLVLLPALQSAQLTVLRNGLDEGAANVDFYLSANAPPACTTGYLPSAERRSPADLSVPDTPDDLYCKIPQSSNDLARGARNLPCMDVPGKRAPTPDICNSDEEYQAIGTNPPFGDPSPGAAPGSPADTQRVQTGGVSYTPPGAAAGAPGVQIGTYDPDTGGYVGADGQLYRANGPSASTDPSLQSLLGVA